MTENNSRKKQSVICLLMVLYFCSFHVNIVAREEDDAPRRPLFYDPPPEDFEILVSRSQYEPRAMLNMFEEWQNRPEHLNDQTREMLNQHPSIGEMLAMKLNEEAKLKLAEQGLEDNSPSASSPEKLPNPSPMYSSSEHAKNGYMSLCHFKICNMGRKRKSN